jgi:hypothetical protein
VEGLSDHAQALQATERWGHWIEISESKFWAGCLPDGERRMSPAHAPAWLICHVCMPTPTQVRSSIGGKKVPHPQRLSPKERGGGCKAGERYCKAHDPSMRYGAAMLCSEDPEPVSTQGSAAERGDFFKRTLSSTFFFVSPNGLFLSRRAVSAAHHHLLHPASARQQNRPRYRKDAPRRGPLSPNGRKGPQPPTARPLALGSGL